MRNLPPDFPHLFSFERRMLEDAVRQQEMLDRALGPSGLEALQAHHAQEKLMERLNPELRLIRENQALLSGKAAHAVALEAALGPARSLERVFNEGHALDGVTALHGAAERAALEGAGLNELRRAEQAVIPYWHDIDRAARTYGTFSSLAKQNEALHLTWGHHAAMSDIERVLRIDKPWIDVMDPGRSFAAFGVLSEIGRAIQAMRDDDRARPQDFDRLLGAFLPPKDFAYWDDARRLDAYARGGVDMRIFDIPREAYGDVAREVGIIQPAPTIRPWRARYASASAKGHGVIIAYRGSIRLEARAQLKAVEMMLRGELTRRAHARYGPGWIEIIVPAPMLQMLRKRLARARFGKSPALLDHTLFSELSSLLQRKEVWPDFFGDVVITFEEFALLMADLIEVRNALFHHRPLDQWELSIAFAAATRLQCAFGVKMARSLR
jgi:hypothetical protein